MRPALQLHLRHHLVGDHLGDQPDEPVTRGAADLGGILRAGGLSPGEPGQLRAVDHLAAGGVIGRRQLARTDPPAHGVITDPEQARGLGQPKLRHGADINAAGEEMLRGPVHYPWISARSCSRIAF